MSEIIRLEGVRKMERGRNILNDVSMSIEEKERVLLYGAPGSGKETLMRLIAGVDMPNEGSVAVLGQALHRMDEKARAAFRSHNIGVVMHHPAFMPRLSILDNVSMPLIAQGVPRTKRERLAREQLKVLDVLHIAQALPSQVSPYEAQLASFARAVIAQPKILLLYEMTEYLSEQEAQRLTSMLHAVREYGDFTVIRFAAAKDNPPQKERYIRLEHGRIQEELS